MAIPRRLIAVALSAAAAGALWYVSTRRRQAERRSAVDEANAEKDRAAARDRADAGKAEKAERSDDGGAGASPGSEAAAGAAAPATSERPAAGGTAAAPSTSTLAGAAHELALFLAGDAWHDEIGWQALWEKEGVSSPAAWLRSRGCAVLVAERRKLVEHPALLAGCRRRWIVVCRYGGIDVGDAATLWNASEAT